MPWPPDPIVANKAPGPPASANEHPGHHNDLAEAINDTVARVLQLEPVVLTAAEYSVLTPTPGTVYYIVG